MSECWRDKQLQNLTNILFHKKISTIGPASGRRSSSVRHFFDTGRRQIGPFWPAAADDPTTSGQQVRRKTRWQKKMTIGLVIAIRARSASTTARPDAGSFWAATTTTVCVCVKELTGLESRVDFHANRTALPAACSVGWDFPVNKLPTVYQSPVNNKFSH